MKLLKFILIIAFIFSAKYMNAQPYSLDKEISLIELKLQEDKRKGHEGEKGIAFFNQVSDSTMYHYVTGHNMFQLVDILVTSISGTPLNVSIAKDNWNENLNRQNTSRVGEGTINYKLRAYDKIGIKIETDTPDNSLYSIVVIASPEVKTHLGSPFKPIEASEMKVSGTVEARASSESGDDGGGGSTMLYIALGIALLIIGVLAGKLMGRKSNTTIVLMPLFFLLSLTSFGQSGQDSGAVLTMEEFENWKISLDEKHKAFEAKIAQYAKEKAGIKKSVEGLNKIVSNIRKNWDDLKTYHTGVYEGLGSCINSTAPAGSPTIPSICTDVEVVENPLGGYDYELNQDSECASCFKGARSKFNKTRYLFEQLATIYKCTKKFSDAALSLGDNASGVHAVAGLAWQNERRNIEKSIDGLEKAYDKKYAELLQDLANSMEELNICEAKYGVEDWFDRFGFMYFEFMKDKYKRSD